MVGSIVRLDDHNLPAACCADEVNQLNELVVSMREAAASARAPFQWVDGPLVTAMRQGDMILIDELNLAEDAVLERLNRQASAFIALCWIVMVAHEQWLAVASRWQSHGYDTLFYAHTHQTQQTICCNLEKFGNAYNTAWLTASDNDMGPAAPVTSIFCCIRKSARCTRCCVHSYFTESNHVS